MQIRLSGYILESIVDGPGLRTVVFTQGCPHHCPGCHNPKTHPFDKGRLMEISDIVEILTSNPLSCGLTISGGEPFVQIDELLELIKQSHLIFLAIFISNSIVGKYTKTTLSSYFFKHLFLHFTL